MRSPDDDSDPPRRSFYLHRFAVLRLHPYARRQPHSVCPCSETPAGASRRSTRSVAYSVHLDEGSARHGTKPRARAKRRGAVLRSRTPPWTRTVSS
jgi:hypothetical protein